MADTITGEVRASWSQVHEIYSLGQILLIQSNLVELKLIIMTLYDFKIPIQSHKIQD
jgi:hypothetical protein